MRRIALCKINHNYLISCNTYISNYFYIFCLHLLFLWLTRKNSSRNIQLAGEPNVFLLTKWQTAVNLRKVASFVGFFTEKLDSWRSSFRLFLSSIMLSKKSFRTIPFFSLKMYLLWEVITQSEKTSVGWRI
jgi:hypothetical protein